LRERRERGRGRRERERERERERLVDILYKIFDLKKATAVMFSIGWHCVTT